MLQTTTERLKRFKSERRGVSNVIVVMLSLVLIVIIVANVVLWSYQMNQVDWQRGQEKLEIISVAFFPSGVTEVTVKNIGSVLAHVIAFWISDSVSHQRMDADTYIDLGQTITYTLTVALDANKPYVIKAVTERGNMAIFTGKFVASNGAMIVYGESTTSIPRYRIWNGVSWSPQENSAPASPTIYWTVLKSCPTRDEKILGVLSSAGFLDVSVWNGENKSWSDSIRVASLGTSLPAYRPFDIAYEQKSGRGIIVYNPAPTGTKPQFRIWNGSSWSPSQEIDINTNGVVYWIRLALKTSSNEIAMITLDADRDICGLTWNGTNWGSGIVLENTASTNSRECIAVEYMQTSGKIMFTWGTGTFVYGRIWNGTSWEPRLPGVNIGATCNWFSLKADPSSNGLVLVSVDFLQYLNTVRWNGTSWILDAVHDYSLQTNTGRCADAEFETGLEHEGHIVLVYGRSDTQSVTFKHFNGTVWSTADAVSTTVFPTANQQWHLLRRDMYGRILIACIDTDYHVNTGYWNGTYLIWTDELELNVPIYTRQCCDLSPDAHFNNVG